jgi:hypothetical protein
MCVCVFLCTCLYACVHINYIQIYIYIYIYILRVVCKSVTKCPQYTYIHKHKYACTPVSGAIVSPQVLDSSEGSWKVQYAMLCREMRLPSLLAENDWDAVLANPASMMHVVSMCVYIYIYIYAHI